MAKKDKDPYEEYLKLKNEMIRDTVKVGFIFIIQTKHKNWRNAHENNTD